MTMVMMHHLLHQELLVLAEFSLGDNAAATAGLNTGENNYFLKIKDRKPEAIAPYSLS